MSQWLKMGVSVKDLELFARVCEKNDLRFDSSSLNIVDNRTHGRFNLVDNQDGTYTIYADSDTRYNPIAKRLPLGMDTISRDYTQMLIEQNYVSVGGSVEDVVENDDGSLTLSIAVGY